MGRLIFFYYLEPFVEEEDKIIIEAVKNNKSSLSEFGRLLPGRASVTIKQRLALLQDTHPELIKDAAGSSVLKYNDGK